MSVGRGVRALHSSHFGAFLRRYRVAAGVTQEELAERAGLSARGISDLERGIASRPHRETLAALVEALGLSQRDRGQLESAAGYSRPVATTSDATTAPGFVPPLVGRSRELAAIERHLAGDGPPVLVLAGEPGIGKSRLLDEAARRARGEGYAVLRGGGQRRSGQEPYAPLLDTLARSAAGLSPSGLRSALTGCAWLVRLLPELLELADAPLPVGTLSAEAERRLIFAAVARYLSNLAGPAGALLLLDDLHWSSPDGLDLLISLLQSGAENRIRMVWTYRDTEVEENHPLANALAGLAERGLAEHLTLPPLNANEARALMEGVLSGGGAMDSGTREKIVKRAGGVPFFLVSCIHGMTVNSEGAATEGVPWNVAQSVRQRVVVLSSEAQDVLRAAAVLGRAAERAILGSVLAAPEEDVLAGLDAACRARLLFREGRSTYRFAHDIVRESIESNLSDAQRVLLHRRAGEAVEALPERGGHTDGSRPAALLAWHFQEGDDLPRALPYAIEAGDRARAVLASEEAERQYRAAVQLSEELDDERHRSEALEKLGSLHWALGRYDEALSTLEASADLYERLGELNSLGRVAGKIGWAHSHRGTAQEGLDRLEPLATRLEVAGASAGLVDVYDALFHLANLRDRPEVRTLAARRAAELAHELRDERILARGALNLGLSLIMDGRAEDAVQATMRAIPLAQAVGDTESLFRAILWTANAYEQVGDLEAATRYGERAIEVAEGAASPGFLIIALRKTGWFQFLQGDWPSARSYAERAVAVEPAASSWAAGEGYVTLAEIALAEGRWEDMARDLAEAREILERTGTRQMLAYIQSVLAARDLMGGRPDAALARFEALEDESRLEEGRLVLAETRLCAGDLACAAATVEEGVAQARASGRRIELVAWLRLLGMVLGKSGRWKEAAAALDESLHLAESIGMPYEVARTYLELASVHLGRGDAASARDRLEEALEIFVRLGAHPYAERAREALKGLARDQR